MRAGKVEVGPSQPFVLGAGIFVWQDLAVLDDGQGRLRAFAELAADPDRPEVRPQEAFRALLASTQPGWEVRFLQAFWPDAAPRSRFLAQLAGWPPAGGEGLALLGEGLQGWLSQAPLPFYPHSLAEFSFVQSVEAASWWLGLPQLIAPYGVQMTFLGPAEIQRLTRRLLNLSIREKDELPPRTGPFC